MIVINKEKIIGYFKDSASKIKDKSKSVYERLSTDIRYIKESQQFSIIKTSEKEKCNKPIFVMFDASNKVIYFKEIDLIQKINNIKADILLKDKNNIVYKVEKVDESKQDYLLKTKKGYKTISCYKIYLKEAI